MRIGREVRLGGVLLLLASAALALFPATPARATCHTVVFNPSEYEVGEKDGSVALTVRNPGLAPRQRTVDFETVSGSSTAGEDFLPASGTLTFNATENARTIAITILDDAADEPAESFQVQLETREGSCITQPGEPASITIQDDDTSSLPAGPRTTSKAASVAPRSAAAKPSPTASAMRTPATRTAPRPEPEDAYALSVPVREGGRGAEGRGPFGDVDGWSIAAAVVLGTATGVWIWRRFAPMPDVPYVPSDPRARPHGR